MNKQIRAEELLEDTWINDNGRLLYVAQIRTNSMGDVVLLCSYNGPASYPCTSLLLRPDELVIIKD